MRKKNIELMRLLILFLAGFSVSFAQLTVPFKARYQGLVKGDMAVIANNIVNRVDYNNSSNVPYYNHTNQAQLNDEFNMDYIDVDNDEDTFSSSSAELFLDNPNNKRIIYAGLYWSATYKYNVGILKNEDKYTSQDSHREAFNAIKIKFPNKEEYIDIVGQTIFDGIKEKEFKDFAAFLQSLWGILAGISVFFPLSEVPKARCSFLYTWYRRTRRRHRFFRWKSIPEVRRLSDKYAAGRGYWSLLRHRSEVRRPGFVHCKK